ncbi:MAG: hypothetical protein ACKOB6_04875 [Candidatus Kapaibacterium sp.]
MVVLLTTGATDELLHAATSIAHAANKPTVTEYALSVRFVVPFFIIISSS